MQALRATSAELQMFPLERNRLKPYAGPQCFPHLQDPGRLFANDETASTKAELGGDAARKQLTECWLHCDTCKKWRVVERASLPALKPEEYVKRREGCVEVDWGTWLGEARARYDGFLHRHGGQEVDPDPESAEKHVDAVESGTGQGGDDELRHRIRHY